MTTANRRKFKRLRIDRSVRVPIHLFPEMPFIGKAVEATLSNISAGGMSLEIVELSKKTPLLRGTKLKIHFRLPGQSIRECKAVITHHFHDVSTVHSLGIKFINLPKPVAHELQQMTVDNESCDRRLREESAPWCIPTCSFYSLCRKPLRPVTNGHHATDHFELAFEAVK
jgi:c-di-GMP-binding flagellar brake protein YcgR